MRVGIVTPIPTLQPIVGVCEALTIQGKSLLVANPTHVCLRFNHNPVRQTFGFELASTSSTTPGHVLHKRTHCATQ